MTLVKNTRQQVQVLMAVDMSWVKKDVLNVNYSLIGKDCGVRAVDACLEQNPELKNQKIVSKNNFIILNE